ncbi:MAG: HNH endonuclease [Mycobacterium sp.]|jgi:hypothetical protein|nr:HNH endonuclease [Mycobacterium sp.]
MSSILGALEALDAAVDAVRAADLDALNPTERFCVLDRMETALRRQVAAGHAIIHRLEQFEGCPPVHIALSDALRISRAEARRRIRDAAQLAPRSTLIGQPLPPELPATAAAWHRGILDAEHLRTIQKFIRELPHHIAPDVVADSEKLLAEQSAVLRPDQLDKVAERLAVHVNPDGVFSDADRARKRGFTWCGGQHPDGMSTGKLIATPELRSLFESWMAKFAAPGMCNPDDQSPCTGGEPDEARAQRDPRGHTQRQHDALVALVRGQLGNPDLGTHRGLPVAVIATATVQELQAQTGYAVTAGSTLLPMSDLIRMASHAYHYLAVFDGDNGRPLYLGRSKRIATADQRIVLHGSERGCSHPGCDVPGYRCEVHHVDEWASGGHTDIDRLTFACAAHHKLLDQGWKTRKLANGDTEWIPPPQLPLIGGTNDFHHPERLLGEGA